MLQGISFNFILLLLLFIIIIIIIVIIIIIIITIIIVLLFNHFTFTEISKNLKLQRANGALPVPMKVLLTVLQITVLVTRSTIL